ncbi:MAG: DUF1501 domain-containing protein, partial [Cyclobacteriaceae bacterium]
MGEEKHIDKDDFKVNRRHFFSKLSAGIGTLALGSLMIPDLFKKGSGGLSQSGYTLGLPHFAPKAKRIIYLFQAGAPSQLESFDYKPLLTERMGEDLPESIRGGQRLTGMTSNQERFPLVGSNTGFKQYGQNGTWVSDYFPHIGK